MGESARNQPRTTVGRPPPKLRFRLLPGVVAKTVDDAGEVVLAVIDFQRGYAKLVEVYETGPEQGLARSIIINFSSDEVFLARADYAEASREARAAKQVVRYVRYTVRSFGQRIEIREFYPPHERHRYALVDPVAGALELPGWIGENVTHNSATDAYQIALEAWKSGGVERGESL
ncbi:hypothetical protein EPN90_02675 [Patescibacteria group bacterium]|nr:MAG: hypothetical protein EPN90_02675 [Patescibacteria group bacterium]